jgi:hypothetical protein
VAQCDFSASANRRSGWFQGRPLRRNSRA